MLFPASVGCRRSSFYRGDYRRERLLSHCLLDGEAYETAVGGGDRALKGGSDTPRAGGIQSITVGYKRFWSLYAVDSAADGNTLMRVLQSTVRPFAVCVVGVG